MSTGREVTDPKTHPPPLSPSRGAPFVGQTLSCWPCISSARRGAAGQLCGEAGGGVPGEGDPSFDQALVQFCCSGSSARGSEGGETNQGKGQSWAVPTAGRSWQSREVGPFPDSAIPPAPPTAALLYLLVRSGQESSCTASLLHCLPPALKPERGQKLPGAEPRRDSSGGCHFGKVWGGLG